MTKEKGRNFVFLAHWVENWNWLLWWNKNLQTHPEHYWWWIWMWPVCALFSLYYLISRRAYDMVDQFQVNGELKGETWLIRNFGWHFLFKNGRDLIRNRILIAILAAQKQHGISVVGLGALTKAEWLTAGGQYIVEKLGKQLHVAIVHGDTLTTIVVLKRLMQLRKLYSLDHSSVFITGATSKIGRALVLALVERNIPVIMYTRDEERYYQIISEARDKSGLIKQASKLEDGAKCDLWITGKAMRGDGKKLIQFLPHQAIVLNFSVPDPLTPKLLQRRSDIRHFDGGLLGYNVTNINIAFTMRLRPGFTYACHAGTIVHAAYGWTHHEIGPVEINKLESMWDAAVNIGFFLPRFSSFLKEMEQIP